MKPGNILPVLSVLTLAAAAIAALPARADEAQTATAELETPFVLAVGQTGRLEPEGLEVTLRSASDDSGCLAPNDCSLATFKGTIAMRLEEESNLATVQAVMQPDSMVKIDFAGYEIRFGTVRRLGKDRVQATFLVTKAPEPETEETDD